MDPVMSRRIAVDGQVKWLTSPILGVVVKADLSTSVKDVYAIGECASWESQTFGLIAPGIEMAEILAFNLTQAKAHSQRKFKQPDMSTKLKLLGVEVASFGKSLHSHSTVWCVLRWLSLSHLEF